MPKITEYTRANIVQHVSENCGMTRAAADEMVKATLDAIQHLLLAGSKGTDGTKIILRGFGAFTTGRTKAKNGRNPQTGEVIRIPASRRMGFSASKDFKAALKSLK